MMTGILSRLSAISLVWTGVVLLFASLAIFSCCAFAEQLPIRRYHIPDGLPSDKVTTIYQDSRGYIWLGTFNGLSRFDGYRFTNYQAESGFDHPVVNAITEDGQGRIWVATNGGGVARLISSLAELAASRQTGSGERPKKFVSYRVAVPDNANYVNAILFDAQGNLWCGTDAGLYRAAVDSTLDLRFELIATGFYTEVFADSQGRLWFRDGQKSLSQLSGGRLIRYAEWPVTQGRRDRGFVEDGEGRLLAASPQGIVELTPDGPQEAKSLPLRITPGQTIRALLFDSSGALWLGTQSGLIKLKDGKQRRYSMAEGLSDNSIESLYEDREGNLWIGTDSAGLCKLSGEMLTSFTVADGLPHRHVVRVIEDLGGNIYALTFDGQLAMIGEENVGRVDRSFCAPFTDSRRKILYSRRGEWWMSTRDGLYWTRDGPFSQARRRVLDLSDVPQSSGSPLHEDRDGNIWFAVRRTIYRIEPTSHGGAVIKRIPLEDDIPGPVVLALATDQSGALWVATHTTLGRLANGRFTVLAQGGGLSETAVRSFFLDSRGWLWLGLRFKGVCVTKDPTAERPEFISYSAENGLLDNMVLSFGEDDAGRMYVGSTKGLSLIDTASGRVRHLTLTDGLAGSGVSDCIRDRRGNIWLATSQGVSRFNPNAEKTNGDAPPVYLSRVQIAGEDLPMLETGADYIPQIGLQASRSNLLIEFVGLSFRNENALKYQYKLDGVDKDWSKPTEQRSLNFARLSPGTYRFLVRAVDGEGLTSARPATIEFQIVPPVWQRWWFVAGVILLTGLAAYLFYRFRVARLIELERVRTRIATDLHDDIGSNLSRIAILSEVVRHEVGNADPKVKEPLSVIATSSRELVDSMSDIVWAINPRRDQFADLAQRMRRFAGDVLTARNIEFTFRAPGDDAHVKVGADVRRQVFLIFREAVNNIARHSDCTAVDVELQIEKNRLKLILKDNGKGFEMARADGGEGLKNMTARAKELGGDLEIVTHPGQGTTVVLGAPLVTQAKLPSSRARRLS